MTLSHPAEAELYDAAYSAPLFRAEDACLASLLARTENAGGYVLDLGCGTGNGLTALHDRGVRPRHYVGVDWDSAMVAAARRKHPGSTWLVADAHEPGLHESRFDLAVSLFAWPYFTNPEYVLRTMVRRTRDGGSVVVLAYQERYLARASHVAPFGCSTRTDTPETLLGAGRRAGLREARVLPFRIIGDALACHLPGLDRVLLAETRLRARWGMALVLVGTA